MVRVSDGDNAVFLFNLIAEASDNISNHFYFCLWILTQRERLSKQYMETDYFSELKILRPPSNFFKYEDQKLC